MIVPDVDKADDDSLSVALAAAKLQAGDLEAPLTRQLESALAEGTASFSTGGPQTGSSLALVAQPAVFVSHQWQGQP